ncbi:MAG: putative toxin-antitoxin system toxin component, PIN family [Deltaproteobacteria bacterium]|nr:putative toxin-antitoxin system toxin component, PIN family [Deltaproteobacteria bacterium]
MHLRAVLDANIFASALIKPSGPPGHILKIFLENQAFELILSKPIIQEINRCLTYPKIKKYILLTQDEIQLWLTAIELLSDTVESSLSLDISLMDPEDEKYIVAALEGKASTIVSGDHHLLTLGEYEGISIVTPRDFLNLL